MLVALWLCVTHAENPDPHILPSSGISVRDHSPRRVWAVTPNTGASHWQCKTETPCLLPAALEPLALGGELRAAAIRGRILGE